MKSIVHGPESASGFGAEGNALSSQLHHLLEDVARCRSRFDVFRVLTAITQAAGYRYFLVADMPYAATADIIRQTIITSAPQDLVTGWQNAGFLQEGRVMQQVRNEGGPFAVSIAKLYADAPDKLAALDPIIKPHGVTGLAVFPVMHPQKGHAIIALMGDPPEMDDASLATLFLLAAKVHDRLRDVTSALQDQSSPLSNREKQCLEWTAAGKTSNEIAAILGLSEHTVNHYLNHAARKVGAVNRAQAVALCMRNRWID